MPTSAKQKHGVSKANKKRDRKGPHTNHFRGAGQPLQESESLGQPSRKTPLHPPIFTIGHGTRKLSDLIQLLRTANVTKLIDVRSIPRSYTNPQFNHDVLQQSTELREARIDYLWFGSSLGGRRNAHQPNIELHTAIRVAAFRNYAGYMSASRFREGLAELKILADTVHDTDDGYLAIMCSETLWWRCQG